MAGNLHGPRRSRASCSSRPSTSKRFARRCGIGDFRGIPAVYDRLRDEPNAVVVELPFYGRRAFFGNAGYMINATRHRHPIVNGYSGFAPGLRRDGAGDAGVSRGCRAGADAQAGRHARRRAPGSGMEQRRADIDANPALRLVAEQDGIAIFRLVSH